MIGWLAASWVVSTAVAQAAEPCVDLGERLRGAWAAFDDAEVAETGRLLELAIGELGCQARPLETDELFELFVLDTTVLFVLGDAEGAAYAAIRGVTLAPDRSVEERFGPDVVALFDTWRRRLAPDSLHVVVDGPADLRVDGHPVPSGGVWTGVGGEHVLQWATRDGWTTQVRELQGWVQVHTGKDTVREIEPPPAPSDAPPRRAAGTPALWGSGLALAVVGGGAVIAGWQVGERFAANPYDGVYDGLSPADPGYREARDAVIERDAAQIRALFGAGYGLMGVGAVLFGVGLGVQPGGAQVSITLPLR